MKLAKKPTGVKTSQSDIIAGVAAALDLPRDTVQEVISQFQGEIVSELKAGNGVQLTLGQFLRADREAGTARNPQTGEQIKTEAKNGARFKVGSVLKNALN